MRYLASLLLILTTIFSKGGISFNEDSIPPGKGIIYGNFIPRLGMMSGGIKETITIMDIETSKTYILQVRGSIGSAKQNLVCFALKPGTYCIMSYCWSQAKWYGAKIITEPIYKSIDMTKDPKDSVQLCLIKEKGLQRFKFTVEANTLNYIGNWHFDTGLVYFTNEKTQYDLKMKKDFKKLDFSTAKTVIPG